MERVKIIIDIKFIDGTYKKGIIAHSIKVYPDRFWELCIYMTQKDVFRENPRLYCDVEKVEIVGVEYEH